MDKQIRELATEILQELTSCYSEADEDCLVKMIRKYIPENVVVLTGDELRLYNEDIERDREKIMGLRLDKHELMNEISEKDNKIKLLEETIECIKFNVDFTRKETAERFAERLKEHPIAKIYSLHNACERIPNAIDKILKEITEGGE